MIYATINAYIVPPSSRDRRLYDVTCKVLGPSYNIPSPKSEHRIDTGITPYHQDMTRVVSKDWSRGLYWKSRWPAVIVS
jgi:hypothetical protein